MNRLARILGCALVGIAAMAGYFWSQLNAQRNDNKEAEARISVATVERPSATPVLIPVAAPPPAPEQAHTVATTPDAPVAPTRGAGPTNAGIDPQLEAARQLQSSAPGQEMLRAMARQMLEQMYPDLAKEMNVSLEVASKVLDLLATRIRIAGLPDPQPSGPRNLSSEGELAALLGSSYPKWNEYERKVQEHLMQDQVRAAISASGDAPLTDAQFQELNTALKAEEQLIGQDTAVSPAQRQLDANRRRIEVAAKYLSPQQLEGYKQHLQQQGL